MFDSDKRIGQHSAAQCDHFYTSGPDKPSKSPSADKPPASVSNEHLCLPDFISYDAVCINHCSIFRTKANSRNNSRLDQILPN